MGRMYTAVFEGVSVSAVQDLFELKAATTGVVVIHKCKITNDTTEASEQLPLRIRRGTSACTSGSGGSAPTPAKHQPGDAAAVTLCEANNTTVLSGGTITTIDREAFNVVGSAYRYDPTPEERLVIPPGEFLVVHLPTAPGAAITMSGSITFEEIG